MSVPRTSSPESILALVGQRHPAHPFLLEVRGSRAWTYGDVSRLIVRRRQRLDEWNLHAGARVGLMVGDPLDFVGWFLAGLSRGLWVAPLDPTVAPADLLQSDARARSLSLVAMIADRTPPDRAVGRWLDARDPLDGKDPDADASANVVDGEDVDTGGVLLASSGTTGQPKVMALSKTQLLTNAELIAQHNELTEFDRGLNPLPLWHINAEVVGVLATLVAGASLVLDERFHRTGFWKIADEFEVTWVNAVPAIIARLVSRLDGEQVPSRLRFVRSASAPLSATLRADFETLTRVSVIESYGMTEAASQICANPLSGPRKPGSVGVPVGVDLRITPTEDRQEPTGNWLEVGHVEIKGPTVITTYESPGYEDRFDSQGWLRTGDLGYIDGDGHVFLVGRSDDVINRGGEKVYPLEIEYVISGVPGVVNVAVVGEPDEVFGQVPVAYVEVESSFRGEVELDHLVDQVRDALADALPRAYRPESLRFIDSLPTHATGKIRKGLVRSGMLVAYRTNQLS